VTLRRRRPLPQAVKAAAQQLKQVETAIALLERVRPTNLAAERARLLLAFRTGERPLAQLAHAPAVALADLRRALAAIAGALDASDPEQRLLAGRAQELDLEAALAEQVGCSGFRKQAARRFPLPHDDHALREHAARFIQSSVTEPSGEIALHASDDQRDPHSLWSQIARLLSARKLPVRVQADGGLVPLAAVADEVVRVRAGARLSAAVGRRIALHEVEGHLLPRASGKQLGGVFLAGSAGASEDEEGRAILLEERAGLLDAARRAELGRRYLAAASVRDGAELWDTVELLGKTGAEAGACIELACRVHRGGGLGRELIYLAGYLRVAEALGCEPRLERLLAGGRVSLDAARELLTDSIELDDDGDVI
jgi:hypothetical protein